MSRIVPVLLLALGLAAPAVAPACTNLLVTKGASADGSTMISYTADSHTLYGELVTRPAAVYPPGPADTATSVTSRARNPAPSTIFAISGINSSS